MSHYFLYYGGQQSLRVIICRKHGSSLVQVHNPQLQKQAAPYGRGEERGMAISLCAADEIQAD